MTIKFSDITKTFTVSYSKRHPVTRKPVSLRRIGIKTKVEANRVYDALVIQVEDGFRKKSIPTWSKAVEEYLEFQTQKNLTSRSIYNDRVCLEKYTAPWKERLCDTITRKEILDLLNKEMVEKAESHKKYILKCIRAVFNFAQGMGYLAGNPTPLIKFKPSEKIKPVLSEPQARILLERARETKNEWYPHWAMALYTGMRNGELYALSWHCVDIEQKKIKVCRAWNRHDGFKDTKSGHDRMIDIAPALLPVLKELYATRIDDFVLPRLHKWDKSEQARDLRMFLMGLGLPQIRFHDLRATWATILLSKGLEPVKVMTMGGWKDMKTMMIYIRKAGIDVSGALDKLNLHNHHEKLAQVINIGS